MQNIKAMKGTVIRGNNVGELLVEIWRKSTLKRAKGRDTSHRILSRISVITEEGRKLCYNRNNNI